MIHCFSLNMRIEFFNLNILRLKIFSAGFHHYSKQRFQERSSSMIQYVRMSIGQPPVFERGEISILKCISCPALEKPENRPADTFFWP